MLKLLKWDFVNYIRKYYWLYCSYFSCIFVMFILVTWQDNRSFISYLFDLLGTLFGLFFAGATFLLSITEAVNWLKRDTYQLERSISSKPWQFLASKLILSLGINLTGIAATQLLYSFMSSYKGSSMYLIKNFRSFLEYLLGILILLIIIMFIFIAVNSIPNVRKYDKILTLILSIVIGISLMTFLSVFYYLTGIWDFRANSDSLYLNVKEGYEGYEMISKFFVSVIFIIGGFIGSCALFKKKCEQ